MAKTETDGAITYFDGAWVEGSPFVARADSHALWMASTVFDGAPPSTASPPIWIAIARA